ncbi:DUF2975 domain-containing protein [Streptococcus loxodontisalivarius]|uniref:DUF2975 domain-containing protein n=1 Tax=Streptococcus loxodontisalivarius TaxID=1349415 RepID=A0ABS2PQ88_9STRE|nr:DUF2975 domain-containing protein [Streptococcus loxodontisalivarius]MBM7642113.1 hypothetical protein [Streptococcus loxodontisalivarius]
MKNDTKKMKWILTFVNVCYYINILALVTEIIGAIVLLLISVTGMDSFNKFVTDLGASVQNTNLGLLGMVFFLAACLQTFLLLLLLRMIRAFLRNVIEDAIFTWDNVRLAKKTSLYLFLLSFLGSGLLFGAGGIFILNTGYLFASLLVWVIAKVLEKAVAIAEENEFTI